MEQHLFLHCHICTFIINLQALAIQPQMRFKTKQLFPSLPTTIPIKHWRELLKHTKHRVCGGCWIPQRYLWTVAT